MYEICVAKFDVYECRKSDRASALSGAQLIICAAQTPEFPDTIPTIQSQLASMDYLITPRPLDIGRLRTFLYHFILHILNTDISERNAYQYPIAKYTV